MGWEYTPDGKMVFCARTRNPNEIYVDMKAAVRDHAGQDALELVAEFIAAMDDHQMVLYAP